MTDKDTIILFGICTIPYLLLGAFWAWLLGVPSGSIAWLAILVLWPAIGFMLFFAGLIITGMVSAILGSVFGRRA